MKRSFRLKAVLRTLTFPAGGFDLAFEFDPQLAKTRLAHRFQPAQGFFDDSPLVFGKIWLTRYAAEPASVVTGARRSHSFNRGLVDADGHGGNSCLLDRARGQPN